MSDSFSKLREILKTGNIPEDTSHFSEPSHRRLLDALRDSSGSGDIVSLVRHVLRREDEKQGGRLPTFLEISRSRFPSLDWKKSSIKILHEGQDSYFISAETWLPEWLDVDLYPPDVPIFKEENYHYESVPGDPPLKLVQLDKYRSIGQREAMRAVLTAPKNSTLVINLPTGSGKSLCAQLPALLNSQNGGVSIVVVPTTALAIDQQRALQPFVNHDTAYYSDDSVEGKARREGIRSRIRAGTQRIIFTSPEALMQSLAPALYQAAKYRMLRYLVVDEAHMVEQWGDGFRPAFQEIPGLRRDLQRLCSFTTLLLTATLTESCLETLETLFGKPGEFQVVSAVQLRKEPAYWFKKCQDEEIKKKRLLEAVHHLPRPLIIYGTTVADVENWQEELFDAGFTRCGLMTGKSSPQEREQLIEKWREGKIDIVVATSAFGLGIDQANVRAVIHVCVPETIDRFYQEVGRGGRDGKACISLTLYTNKDLEIAQDLNDNSAITVEKGLLRWQSMFNRKEPVDGKYRVPIDIPPSYKEKYIDMNSDQNTAWNIRTLTLMNRAGLIEIDVREPPQRRDFESEESYDLAWKYYRNSRIIRICDQLHSKQLTWQLNVEPIRQQRQSWSYKNLRLMKEALTAQRCISEIFAEAYTISAQTRKVTVSRACGGCAVCRKNKVKPFSGNMFGQLPVWQQPNYFVGKELQSLLKSEKLLVIFYESLRDKKHILNRAFKWLVEQGIINMIIPYQLDSSLIEEINQIPNSFIFLFEKYQPIMIPPIPTLIYHPQGVKCPENYLSQNNISQAPRIILLPIDTPDPSRTDRRLIDIFSGNQLKFDSFCIEIGL